MRTLTATDASRRFSDLLDAIERGETITVTRAGRAVAEIHPPRQRTGRHLRDALDGIAPPHDGFETEISDALSHASPDGPDAWADA